MYELSNLVNLRIRTPPYHSNLIFHLSPHGFRYRKARRVAHSHTGKPNFKWFLLHYSYVSKWLTCLSSNLVFVEEVIKQRKKALKEEKEVNRIQAKRNLDFLDILLFARVCHMILLITQIGTVFFKSSYPLTCKTAKVASSSQMWLNVGQSSAKAVMTAINVRNHVQHINVHRYKGSAESFVLSESNILCAETDWDDIRQCLPSKLRTFCKHPWAA